MHPYLPHLLADLETAKANKPAKPNYRLLYPDHPAFEYGLDYIAEWELGKNKPLKGWLGIEPENFPPKDQFEESDLEAVVEKFLDLLLHFNVSVMLPDEMPYAMVYDLLVGYLEEEIHIVSEGSLVMDFCSGEPVGCLLGEYCSCKDLNFDDMNDEKKETGELPF